MEPDTPDPALLVVSTFTARAVRKLATWLDVEPVRLAAALRSAVAVLATIVATVLGVSIPPAVLAVATAVLVGAEGALAAKVRAKVTPNRRVVVSQDELDELDAILDDAEL